MITCTYPEKMTTATSVHLNGRLNLALVWEAARMELLKVLGKPDLKKVAT